jgi:hypothetical protein
MAVGGLNLHNNEIWSEEADHDDEHDPSNRRPRFVSEGPVTQSIRQYLSAADAEELQIL